MQGNILLERNLPLSWTLIDPATPRNAEPNHLIFTLLDNLDEPTHHKADMENVGEFMRIEAKLNVIMQLLGQLLQSRQAPPPVFAIRFTSDTLAWQVEQPLPVGSLLRVALYPEDRIPLALTFEAKVLGHDDHWLEVDMHGLNEEERAMWSRWVFRQHRRHVAHARIQQ
jgi:hypothetical protein